ncbi:secreted antigen 1 [Babesia caballi]|uniref:Secreted antigen 1 n=1 Tax=Babesia caballi TaxID=5871 RepID=A0AAV4LN20_BABCB|nr:secreted antigen 1 [Babesia caballi]
MTTCPSAPEPKNLKEALEFAGALSNQGLWDNVGKELQKRVSEYSSAIPVKTYLTSSLDNLQQLRVELVNNSWIYGPYTNLKSHISECLADAVTDCFPKLYCTLSYFNFNINGNGQRGGGWASKDCSSNNLGNWLKGKTEMPSASGQTSSATIWSGGFDGGELQCQNASRFKNQLKDCVEENGDKFPLLLSGILFLEPSLPELTSTLLVFVLEMCIVVTGENEDREWYIDGLETKKPSAKLSKVNMEVFPTTAPSKHAANLSNPTSKHS